MVNKVFRFTWAEWKWMAIIVMLGVVMYWTALVVQPTFDLVQNNNDVLQQGDERAKQAEQNVKLLMANQDNNTQRLEELLIQHNHILEKIGQVILIQEHEMNQTLADILIEKQMRQWVDELRANLTSGRGH